MKKVFIKIKNTLIIIWKLIINVISSTYLPFVDVFQEVANLFLELIDLDYEEFNKIIKKINTRIQKKSYYSLAIYYLFLLGMEIFILFSILRGKIIYYDFWILFCYSSLFIVYSFIFVVFLNKHFKSKDFNYIIYFQLLFLLPLGVLYWIANIEGHDIYLKNLNSDQWISLFNTIIIYFSGSLIGIITLYKNKEVQYEKRTKKQKNSI